mgnify:CR=1 FL=1
MKRTWADVRVGDVVELSPSDREEGGAAFGPRRPGGDRGGEGSEMTERKGAGIREDARPAVQPS